MTTMRPRQATNPKEKRSLTPPMSPQRSVSSNGRRSPRPNTPVNKQTVTDKPTTPNYLRPKSATPAVNPPKSTKTIQPTPTATSKRVPVPKPSEKPALAGPELSRSLPSPPRKGGPIRLPTAAPRQFNTLKPSLDKIPKVNFEKLPKVTNGMKTRQVTRTKSLENRSGSIQVKHEVPSAIMPQNQEPQQQENESLVTDSCAPIETQDANPPELKKDTEEVVTDDHVEPKEEQKEVISTTVIVVKERENVIKPVSERKEAQKVDEAKTPKMIKPPQRGPVAAKKEAVRNNDVIEKAKSKFLEKRKNKVLALVGAFETVMALQEPEGQQPKEKDGEMMTTE